MTSIVVGRSDTEVVARKLELVTLRRKKFSTQAQGPSPVPVEKQGLQEDSFSRVLRTKAGYAGSNAQHSRSKSHGLSQRESPYCGLETVSAACK